MDVVLLKSDGIPTYHFAHAVDDHFMRTNLVIRGDEWLASYPLHKQLFDLCGFALPKYAHIAPIMKLEVTVDEEGEHQRKESSARERIRRLRLVSMQSRASHQSACLSTL